MRLLGLVTLSLMISGCNQAPLASSMPKDTDLYVVNCVTFEQKPVELVLYCADAGQILNEISWSSWTATEALGTGTSTANDCEPSCAEGNDVVSAIEIKLFQPITSESGKRVFSQIEIQYDKVQPSGVMDEVLDLPTNTFN